jgi:hypothetical protein
VGICIGVGALGIGIGGGGAGAGGGAASRFLVGLFFWWIVRHAGGAVVGRTSGGATGPSSPGAEGMGGPSGQVVGRLKPSRLAKSPRSRVRCSPLGIKFSTGSILALETKHAPNFVLNIPFLLSELANLLEKETNFLCKRLAEFIEMLHVTSEK